MLEVYDRRAYRTFLDKAERRSGAGTARRAVEATRYHALVDADQPYGYDRHDESEPSIIGKTADGGVVYGPPEGIEEPLEGEGEPEIVYLDAPPPGARPGRVHPD